MFYIEGNTVIGVLCDWDLAEKKVVGQKFVSPRCGTPTYMALDLLACGEFEHEYRHDLESFYWVFVWFIINHNPSTRQFTTIAEWTCGTDEGESESLLELAMHKAEFIDVYQGYHPVLMEQMQSCYAQLIPIVMNLSGLFLAERMVTYRRSGLYGLGPASQAALDENYWRSSHVAVEDLCGVRIDFSMFMEAVDDAW